MTALLIAGNSHHQVEAASPVVRETPRCADAMTLVAVHSAIGCARMFVSHTLRRWNARCLEDDALLVVTELVTDAVRATGVIDEHSRWTELDHLNIIRVRLLAMDASIAIEVWDSDPEPPEPVRRKGNYLLPRSGGKVVWCQLAFPRPGPPLA